MRRAGGGCGECGGRGSGPGWSRAVAGARAHVTGRHAAERAAARGCRAASLERGEHELAPAQASRYLPTSGAPLGSRLRATRLAPSRFFLDSSATGREAAGSCAAGGMTSETCGPPGGDFSSTLLSQKSLFRTQTVRLLFDARIRSPTPTPVPERRNSLFHASMAASISRPQETDSRSDEPSEGSSAQGNSPGRVRSTTVWKSRERELSFTLILALVLTLPPPQMVNGDPLHYTRN